jgi:antitoxin (DNA-binding transcriptional repressor) of toxin-antitoxin stability system
MIEIEISEFQAKCLELLEQVRLNGSRIRITEQRKTIAEIVPVPAAQPIQDRAAWIASMKDSFEITGDIVSLANDADEWECLRD